MKITKRNIDHPVLGKIRKIDIDPGRTVLCDLCNLDYTDSDEKGGFSFGSNAVCPACAPPTLKRIYEYYEEQHIQARCPLGKSFADWVREDLR